MAEHISLIESMNKRLKAFMEAQDELKRQFMTRITRIETEFVEKTFEIIDQKFDFKAYEQSLKKLSGDVDVFRVDHLSFKEIASGKLENLDVIYKKVSNDSFNRVRKAEEEFKVLKEEFIKINEENITEN